MSVILILLATTSTLLLESHCDTVEISTPSGHVLGQRSPRDVSVTRFLAVPYADTPVRFEKATISYTLVGYGIHSVQCSHRRSCRDLLNATGFGPTCYSYGFKALYPASEDCLTVDIYTPAAFSQSDDQVSTTTEQLPVMVNGSILSAVGRVVVVVIQYRLAAFGFLYTEGITPSNLGLWDQKLALRWVNENIQSYGGDNHQVTIFGESAGSISIALHLMSPVTNSSHFQRAILQSGTSLVGDQNRLTRSEQVTDFSRLAGCVMNANLIQKVECLRRVPAAGLHNVTVFLIKHYYFWAAVDGDFVPYDGFDLVAQYNRFKVMSQVVLKGQRGVQFLAHYPAFGESCTRYQLGVFNSEYIRNGLSGVKDKLGYLDRFDTLMGFNSQEGISLTNPTYTDGLDNNTYVDGINHDAFILASRQHNTISNLIRDSQLTDALTVRAASLYENQKAETGGRQVSQNQERLLNLVDFFGDYILSLPTLLLSVIHADAAPNKHSFFYLFDHKSSYKSPSDPPADWIKTGANHADDLLYIFQIKLDGTGALSNISGLEEQISHDMMKYWTNFARTGDPNGNWETSRNRQKWKELTVTSLNYLHITTREDLAETNLKAEKLEMFLCVAEAFAERNPELVCDAGSSAPRLLFLSFKMVAVVVLALRLF